jgi:ABC-type xylose transport system permease subunit
VGAFDQAWRSVRALGWYRRLRATQRILGIAFLAAFVLLVAGRAAGLSRPVWIAMLYVDLGLGVIGGVLAWTVVALVAVTFARRTVDPADQRFTSAWLVPLAIRYFQDFVGVSG